MKKPKRPSRQGYRDEREASEEMLDENASATQSITAGMDKAYDVKEHVERLHVKKTHHLSRRTPQQETRH